MTKKDEKIKKDKKPKKEKKKEETKDYEDMYKRALADYHNLQKQSVKEKQEFLKFANEQLLHQIIPVYDNLKTSLKHTDEQVEGSAWAEGVKYIVKQFHDLLSDLGVEEIKTVGEKFNPDSMEAMKGEGETVRNELRPGYKLNGKVIIAAKVEVGK